MLDVWVRGLAGIWGFRSLGSRFFAHWVSRVYVSDWSRFFRGWVLGFRIQVSVFQAEFDLQALGFGFRFSGLAFRVSNCVFRASSFIFRVSCSVFRVSGFGLQISGVEFRIFGVRISGFEPSCPERAGCLSYKAQYLTIPSQTALHLKLTDFRCPTAETRNTRTRIQKARNLDGRGAVFGGDAPGSGACFQGLELRGQGLEFGACGVALRVWS